MAENIATNYRRLFDVRVFHHYWLDEGSSLFDQLTSDQQSSRLLTYDMRMFFTLAPTPATQTALRSYGCFFRETALGGLAAAPDGATLPDDQVFEFTLAVNNGQLFDYTSLTFRRQQIYNLVGTVDGRMYRYKENVAVLSNLTGVTRGAGLDQRLFLSQETPALATEFLVESLATDGGALVQCTSDGPGATTQQIGTPASALPVFVHQGDAPVIVPPAGVTGAPARGVRLSADLTDDVFAVIRLTAVRGDNADFSFVDGAGAPKATPPVYHIRFKNRMTFWTYRNQRTGAVDSMEPKALPLTFFGNAGTKQKPSRGHVKADMNGAKVARLVSEIFI
jgi:hypothetical protein